MADQSPPTSTKDDTLPPAPIEDDERFELSDYIVVNAAFLGFLLIAYLIMLALFHDASGLKFFFIVLGVGFVAVSAYDYLFDRLYVPPTGEGE